jgi:hypothetical protein
MKRGKQMRNKKRWIITSSAALLLAIGGVGVLAGSVPAPMTHEETLKRTEEKFGKPTPMPTVEGLKDQLAQVQATAPTTMQEDPQKRPDDQQKAEEDWMKAELLKQQIIFAELAPSPMPTGHSSYVVAGKQP